MSISLFPIKPQFPIEILSNIFQYMDFEDLFSIVRVNKIWNKTVIEYIKCKEIYSIQQTMCFFIENLTENETQKNLLSKIDDEKNYLQNISEIYSWIIQSKNNLLQSLHFIGIDELQKVKYLANFENLSFTIKQILDDLDLFYTMRLS